MLGYSWTTANLAGKTILYNEKSENYKTKFSFKL